MSNRNKFRVITFYNHFHREFLVPNSSIDKNRYILMHWTFIFFGYKPNFSVQFELCMKYDVHSTFDTDFCTVYRAIKHIKYLICIICTFCTVCGAKTNIKALSCLCNIVHQCVLIYLTWLIRFMFLYFNIYRDACFRHFRPKIPMRSKVSPDIVYSELFWRRWLSIMCTSFFSANKLFSSCFCRTFSVSGAPLLFPLSIFISSCFSSVHTWFSSTQLITFLLFRNSLI